MVQYKDEFLCLQFHYNVVVFKSPSVRLQSHTLLLLVVSLRLFVFFLLQGCIPSLHTDMVLVFHLHGLSHSSRSTPDRNSEIKGNQIKTDATFIIGENRAKKGRTTHRDDDSHLPKGRFVLVGDTPDPPRFHGM